MREIPVLLYQMVGGYPSWKYIRKYKLDRVVHHISETWNRIKENRAQKNSTTKP